MAKSWRDSIKVHPAADLFPMMSDGELDALANDIAEHGLQQPSIVHAYAGEGLLDGRNRLAAIARIPNKQRRDYLRTLTFRHSRTLSKDDDPYAFVISANLHRRHLTTEQKRDVIAALLKTAPERSNRTTAKIAQVSHPTVASVRRELENNGDVENFSTRVDSKGRHQPANKPTEASPLPDIFVRLCEQADETHFIAVRGREIAEVLMRELGTEKLTELLAVFGEPGTNTDCWGAIGNGIMELLNETASPFPTSATSDNEAAE